ncbi:hypothetical protein PIB30_013004 [Stylosanthes scabra]|uniref:Zinc knuckle CX2CX4HX4C domain-containing protein n=1 Tax=Stylosanthes scabra TaxID=79078 RepID=A0ABU6R652_9FABA|nr:hypothetical protein [Stylosanthes scabra]
MASNSAFQLENSSNDLYAEDRVIPFNDEDVREGLEKCSKSLIGRLLSDRSFSAGALEAALLSIWRHPEGFKRWKADSEICEADFGLVPIWIQLWGLEEHCKTTNLGRKVGGALGEVLDTDLFTIRGKEVSELQLKYERIVNFCHFCGHVGHEIRSCNLADSNQVGDLQQNSDEISNYSFPNPNCNLQFSVGESALNKGARSGRRQNLKSLARKGSSYKPVSGVKRSLGDSAISSSLKKLYQPENTTTILERVPPKTWHPRRYEDADVELLGFGETPDGSQHPRDL